MKSSFRRSFRQCQTNPIKTSIKQTIYLFHLSLSLSVFFFNVVSRFSASFDCSSSYMNQQSEVNTPMESINITHTWILKFVRKSMPNKTKINKMNTIQVKIRTELLMPGLKMESMISWNIFVFVDFKTKIYIE